MTPKQITKKLTAAGFNPAHIVEIDRDEVTIAVMDPENEGIAKFNPTRRAVKKAAKILGWGGTYSQWGGCRLSAHHEHDPYAGTKAGREHY